MTNLDEFHDIILFSDPATWLATLKQLKNLVIGHNDLKEEFLQRNIVPALLQTLSNEEDEKCQIEATIILGSFAYGE